MLGAASLLFYAQRLEKSDIIKFDTVKKSISYAFLGLLLIVALQSILSLSLPDAGKTPLMVATILLGAITFYLNRDKLDEIEDEARQEEIEEKRRELEFAERYPRINKLWGVKRIASWMYKEGGLYGGGLLAIVLIGFILRIWNLGKLGYSTDEGSTALYAFYIDQTGLPCSEGICYLRGLPYLYFVSIFTKIFGLTEFWVRFSGVIIATTAVILLYILVRKIGYPKNTALLGAFLIVFADWHFMLSRYARMYGMLLFFVILSLIFYLYVFHEKKKNYLFPLIISVILALLTHQFSMLLIFLLLIPFITKEYNIYRQRNFIFFTFFLFIALYLALIKLPGIIFSNGYVGVYDLFPVRNILDEHWYFERLQNPNFIYVEYMLKNLPTISIIFITVISLQLMKTKNDLKTVLSYFLIFSFIIFAIFKIDYNIKYLWWILPIIYFVFAQGLALIFKINKIYSYVIIILLLISSVLGIAHIISTDYGTLQNSKPLIMPTHVEKYYIDDKTPVDFLKKKYKEGDIIITDYWMQDVYLMLELGRKSDYFISRWNSSFWMNKFPYYKLYYDGRNYRISQKGPVYINEMKDIISIIINNKRVWYISSADFDGRKYEYISTSETISWLNKNNIKPVYVGRDNNSKVYLFNNFSLSE